MCLSTCGACSFFGAPGTFSHGHGLVSNCDKAAHYGCLGTQLYCKSVKDEGREACRVGVLLALWIGSFRKKRKLSARLSRKVTSRLSVLHLQ